MALLLIAATRVRLDAAGRKDSIKADAGNQLQVRKWPNSIASITRAHDFTDAFPKCPAQPGGFAAGAQWWRTGAVEPLGFNFEKTESPHLVTAAFFAPVILPAAIW